GSGGSRPRRDCAGRPHVPRQRRLSRGPHRVHGETPAALPGAVIRALFAWGAARTRDRKADQARAEPPAYARAMDPVQRALWFVESHLREPIALGEIAAQSGVSPYHLTRAFDAVTGHSLMRYVRARRLSEAARTLFNGAPDILTVALDAGYGSHEA